MLCNRPLFGALFDNYVQTMTMVGALDVGPTVQGDLIRDLYPIVKEMYHTHTKFMGGFMGGFKRNTPHPGFTGVISLTLIMEPDIVGHQTSTS